MVPDLAVEVVSKSNTADQIAMKSTNTFKRRVSAVWVIYPGTTKIYVYDSPTRVSVLQRGDVLDGGTMLPDFVSRCPPCSMMVPRKREAVVSFRFEMIRSDGTCTADADERRAH